MLFTVGNYRDAAKERIEAAKLLQSNNCYALATYLAGRAVESVCIGYLVKNGFEHRCGHDLSCLYKYCGIARVIPEMQAEAVGEAFGILQTRWTNDHRFLSDAAFKKFLSKRNLYVGIKGEHAKENCRIAVEAAALIVSLGDEKWTR